MIAVATPTPFFAIGQFYDDFWQTSDEAVVALLARQAAMKEPTANPDASSAELPGHADPGRQQPG